ncbi:MAG: calcium/sodium antiporter [Cyclobacteriaceae bacterium]
MLNQITIWFFTTDSIALAVIFLMAGFVVLIKGADFLVNGASSIAKGYGVSDLAIGLTVVAFGTSLPELIVSLFSALDGKNDATFGNVLGSNNFNLMFILGISGVIYPLVVQRNTIRYEVPLSFGAAILLYFLVNDGMLSGGQSENILSRTDSMILLTGFAGFLYYIYMTMKDNSVSLPAEQTDQPKSISTGFALLLIITGLAMLVGGGKTVVDSAIGIAQTFGLSEKLIGLTILAAGTSLPELATSAVAAYRKNTDIAIGNVVGSNIFNILLILGVTGTVSPIPFNPIMNFDFYVLLGATVLLTIFMFTLNKNKLDRWEALILLIIFVSYTTYLILQE